MVWAVGVEVEKMKSIEREVLRNFRIIEECFSRNNVKFERIKIEARGIGKKKSKYGNYYHSIDFPVKVR
jgi:tRNA isopentenyl-2-thiomethyl-A-37 hydroxylase MiaE